MAWSGPDTLVRGPARSSLSAAYPQRLKRRNPGANIDLLRGSPQAAARDGGTEEAPYVRGASGRGKGEAGPHRKCDVRP
jgi:hypothetical protein